MDGKVGSRTSTDLMGMHQTRSYLSDDVVSPSLHYNTHRINEHTDLPFVFLGAHFLFTWSYQLFLPISLFSVHSCFYSNRLTHWMAFYVLMCR